jgi:hypothetical protein
MLFQAYQRLRDNMKKCKDHTIYEVHNKYHSESVFVDIGRRPNKKEIREICQQQKWFGFGFPEYLDVYIKKYILVEKLHPFYTHECIDPQDDLMSK